jgi:hypothetical protein
VKSFTAYKTFLHSLIDNSDFNFDVITFTETWANEQLQEMLNFQNYNSEFKHKINRKEGGGLAVYITEALRYKSRHDLQFPMLKQNEYDALFVEITSDDPCGKNTVLGNM